MVLETAELSVFEGKGSEFEVAFREASPLIASIPGYISHTLHRSIETPNRYLLLVQWETLEAHTIGFRQSEAYQEWKKLLHHFYNAAVVEHYNSVDLEVSA